jgi:cell division protein DivIC
MSNRLNIIWSLIRRYKYAVVFVIGITIVGFVDDNSFIHLMRYNLQIDELHSEINKYNAQHEADSKKLNELKRNPRAIEKIARERYFMKSDDEDIFILSDDEKTNGEQNETTE